MSQYDLVCSACPLLDCDEESLWCLYRLQADPNRAQRKGLLPAIRRTLARKDYFAAYYAANRERKLAAAKERYANQTTSKTIG